MEFRDQDFSGQEITLDGNTFTGCTFRNCHVVFRATASCTLTANHFKENVNWAFDGPAALTVQFMTALYHGMGKGGRELVEQIFEGIRRGSQGGDAPIGRTDISLS